MATPGANLSYHSPSRAWELFLRKAGFKPGTTYRRPKTSMYDMAADDGTTFPRQVGICVKYSTTTAPQNNTAADAPTGVGDICVYVAANNAGVAHIPVASIDIYRCTVYTNTTTVTWVKIID